MTKPRSSRPTPVMREMRAAPRIGTSISVDVIAGRRRVPFEIDNLSASGARLIGPLALSLGDLVQVVLASELGPREIVAEVVRVHTSDLLADEVAVRFVSVPNDCDGAIRELVQRTLASGQETSDFDDDRVTTRIQKVALAVDVDGTTLRFKNRSLR